MPDTRSKKRITNAFIKELEGFKRGGYGFLFEGTQRESFDAYLDGLKTGHQEGYFEIPTGVGKTALFIAIIGCYLKATQNIPDAPKVLIHEPSNDLVMQTALAFADFMPAIAKTIETEDDRGRIMDFDNSAVELHYSKRKGAKNGHKVLITTYQSQAADERKGEDRPKTFTPEDFGLVIHDEAHYLTGPKYGPAAVDKFKGAIQLGVTATPEYSDNKTVANKLAHRYYHLPLNTAIERGDLCHVRPMLIKTHLRGNDRINLERARRFLEERHGQPLTPAQLEQLLNQKARNQAIIKAYLTGSHPDTGERFLGQTGMIFAGGITHCGDFIRNAEDVLKQPKYRPIKRWLADEGLALIAPIHSAVPKDGIDITIGGQKRKCTKDEIKELHRQGKILLIISDQELKLGTDFPRDSFIAEIVDRFSVPDATQRMGRGFRVDRGSPRHGLPPNPDKSCAAANVIDETTHETYKGTPHHPIHAIEILHGAVHRPPMRRIGAMTTRHFRQNPPEVTESVEELGFELISRVEALRAVARKFEEGKKKPLPDKTDEWLSREDIRGFRGGQRKEITDAVIAIFTAYDEKKLGEQRIAFNGQSIRTQKMQAYSAQPLCIYRQDWSKVEKAAGVSRGGSLPEKTDKWLSPSDTRVLAGGTRVAIQDAVAAILAAYDERKLGEQAIACNGQSIRTQKLQSGTTQPVCIYREDWPKVEKAAGVGRGSAALPEKTDKWLSRLDMVRLPGGQRQAVENAVVAILSAYDEKKLGEQTIAYNGQSIRTQRMQSGTRQPICIYRQDWPKVEKAAGVSRGGSLPEKTDEWLTRRDAMELLGGNRNSVQDAVAAILATYDEKKLGMQTITYNGQSIRTQKMQSGINQPVCIYHKDWPKVEMAAGVSRGVVLPEKTDEWLSREDIKDKPGGQRKAVRDAISTVLAAYDEEKLGTQTIAYNGQSIRTQKMQSGTKQSIYIYYKDWPQVENAAGVSRGGSLPEKTDEWLTREDIKSLPGGARGVIRDAVAAIITNYDEKKLGEQTIAYNGQSIRTQKMQSGTQQPICICRQDWAKVEKAIGVEPRFADDSLKSSPITKRDITPGGEHLNRTGRGRGASDGQ